MLNILYTKMFKLQSQDYEYDLEVGGGLLGDVRNGFIRKVLGQFFTLKKTTQKH